MDLLIYSGIWSPAAPPLLLFSLSTGNTGQNEHCCWPTDWLRVFCVFFSPPPRAVKMCLMKGKLFKAEPKDAPLFSPSCSVLMTRRLWVMIGWQNRGWGCLSACSLTDYNIWAVRLAPLHNDKKGFISIALTKDCQHKGKYRLMQIKDHARKLEGQRRDLHHTHECFCVLLCRCGTNNWLLVAWVQHVHVRMKSLPKGMSPNPKGLAFYWFVLLNYFIFNQLNSII